MTKAEVADHGTNASCVVNITCKRRLVCAHGFSIPNRWGCFWLFDAVQHWFETALSE